jgi:hypothetical protein
MSDTDTQLFRLLDPDGKEIMSGPMSIIMEHLPDTNARNAALDGMLRSAIDAVEAEERTNQARTAAAQILSDGITRLCSRMDSFEKARALSMKRAEAEIQHRARQRVAAMLDALPDPDEPEPTTEPYSIDRKQRMADQEPNEILPPPRESPGPEPGSLDYPPHPQIAAPTAISLNSANEA